MPLLVHLELSSGINFASRTSSLNFLTTNASWQLDSAVTLSGGSLNLKDNIAGTIKGSGLVTFVGSILNTGTSSLGSTLINMSGTFDPTSTDTVTLNDGDFLDIRSGTILQSVTVAAGATVSIFGQPKFNSSVSLGSAGSVLQFGITTPLNQSVTGSGKVKLLSDLSVQRGVQLPSLVDQNSQKLVMNGGLISSTTTNTGGGVIELAGYTNLTGVWTIGSGADVYSINGNGAILDLTASGGITFNGTTLYLNDVNVRGLQTANAIKGTGVIKVSNCSFQLAGDFTRTDGSFNFIGEPSTIISSGSSFNISGSGNTILVDGIILRFEQLDGTGTNPINAISSATLTYSNGGLIQSGLGGGGTSLNITSSSYSLAQDIFMSLASPLVFSNTSGTNFDGAGHFIYFPVQAGAFFVLNANVPLTLYNTVLKNFYPAAISYGSLSSLTLSDGVRIDLGPDLTILSTDPAWNFNGTAEIDGKGGTLRIQKSQGITITGAKTLTLKNMRLEVTQADAIKALTDTATIKLQNVELVLQNPGFILSTGSMVIAGDVKVTGATITSTPQSTFELTTKGTLTIGENANLFIDRNIKLKYNINPVNDTTVYASKRHIVMAYLASTITLNGCSFESTATGVAFDSGTIQIQDNVGFTVSSATAAELELSANARLSLSSGAVLDVDGPLRYIP